MEDIRDFIFKNICQRRYRAILLPERDGILSGVEEAAKKAEELGVEWTCSCKEGDPIYQNQSFAELVASPKQIAMAEECLIGTLAKTSGIATAARQAVDLAAGRVKIVSGSWKKMPPNMKHMVRQAVTSGGASFRICEPPMLYLDKNFVWMFGSVEAALSAAANMDEVTKVIQLKGVEASIEEETRQAVEGGAGILMVDTGNLKDVEACLRQLEDMGQRKNVRIAFAGNVKMTDIPTMADHGIDLLCIGKEIIDAGLLDMKLNVIGEAKE